MKNKTALASVKTDDFSPTLLTGNRKEFNLQNTYEL